jgi:hypothetical protein
MPKKKPTTGESRHGKIPDGWEAQGLQIPRALRAELREAAGEFGNGGVKIIGTAAIAIVMALEPEERSTLCKYVFQKTFETPEGLNKRRVLELLKMLLVEDDENTAPLVEPVWYVDKILDPEITPEPGKKWSDRHPKGKDERKQGG